MGKGTKGENRLSHHHPPTACREANAVVIPSPPTRNVTTARFVNLDLGFLGSLGFRAREIGGLGVKKGKRREGGGEVTL